MKVCFIGHRKVEVTEELRSALCALLLELIREGATDFLFGDHSQFNDLCYDAMTELRQDYPRLRRVKLRTGDPELSDYAKRFFFDGYCFMLSPLLDRALWQVEYFYCVDIAELELLCPHLQVPENRIDHGHGAGYGNVVEGAITFDPHHGSFGQLGKDFGIALHLLFGNVMPLDAGMPFFPVSQGLLQTLQAVKGRKLFSPFCCCHHSLFIFLKKLYT